MNRMITVLSFLFIVGLSIDSFCYANTMYWIGQGADDRWLNPDNWQGGILPTKNDSIDQEPSTNPIICGPNPPPPYYCLHNSVTIDGEADADSFVVSGYAHPHYPFSTITLLPGAQVSIRYESLDPYGDGYIQKGGDHVADEFYFYGYAPFRMTGGTFKAGAMGLFPDSMEIEISGGTLQVEDLTLGGSHHIGGLLITDKADLHVTNSLTTGFGICNPEPADINMSWEGAVHMEGAGFVNNCDLRASRKDIFDSLKFVFTDGNNVSMFEVGGGDYGPVPTGFVNNWAVDTLQVGDICSPGNVKLVDNVNNYPDYIEPGAEALYVDTLIIGKGSILDLNGYHLYYNRLSNQGGIFRNGSATRVPQPFSIDIKPGDDSNTINYKSKGKIPVAIPSTNAFNAPTQVDRLSLTFGRTGSEHSLAFCSGAEDVNGDGLQDLVCHFYTEETGFQCGDTEGILKGMMVNGIAIEDSDLVTIVPCKIVPCKNPAGEKKEGKAQKRVGFHPLDEHLRK